MPYSFVQIEQDKSRAIQWSIAFLFLLYFLAATVIVLLIKAYLGGYFTSVQYHVPVSFWSFLSWSTLGWTFLGSGITGIIHFGVSTNALIDQTLRMMEARIANPALVKELTFKNVVDEASIATGGKYAIEAWMIPTSAMNAFALQDFQGRSVIGITEGLLLRLNREQLEAVVAHEAGHIASGDCKETTITSVLFKVFDNVCDVSFHFLRFSGGGRSRRGGGVLPLIVIVLVVAWVFKFVSVLGSLFVSRQREYRADAISARLTRNPKALAEALHIISGRWKGAGIPGQAMEAIFILSPRKQAIDESVGLFADLFSTHPPIQRRISILLDMAHGDEEDLNVAAQKSDEQYQRSTSQLPAPNNQYLQWLAFRDGKWAGPFSVGDIKNFNWLTPQTMVKRLTEPATYEAGNAPGIREVFTSPVYRGAVKDFCPRCNVKLTVQSYEGFSVLLCFRCGGHLVSESDTLNILGKRDAIFDQRIKDAARLVREQIHPMKRDPFDQIYDERSIVCPSCLDQRKKMHRRFVSQKYPVEVDKCQTCARVWFDKDELEILQVLYETDHPRV
ncbi:MAG: M48 family metalloprotease [Candidatus Omnitrophica bacterium]|nr:M48 family metalloprotease [Candidatus Omnitrophota bacterium]